MQLKFIIFILLITSIEVFPDEFYTISICSTSTYEDAVFCKNKILKKHDYDITIVKINNTKYRTNYGVFNSFEDAKKVEKTLDYDIKQQQPFIIKIDKNKPDIDACEIYPKEAVHSTINTNNNEKLSENPKSNELEKPNHFSNNSQMIENNREKIAYLTFDDGPIIATKNILEVVEQEDIPISMFFVGSQIENFKSIYENALSHNKITIGNHTYSHANGKYKQFYSNAEMVVDDVKKANILISKDRNSTTQSPFLPIRLAGRNVFRLPFISRDDFGLGKEQTSKEWLGYEKVFQEGFYIYGWDIEWSYETTGKPIGTPLDIVNSMESINSKNHSRLPNKVVVLMHDRMFNNHFNGKENLQTFIKLLKNNGWKFDNIERYF